MQDDIKPVLTDSELLQALLRCWTKADVRYNRNPNTVRQITVTFKDGFNGDPVKAAHLRSQLEELVLPPGTQRAKEDAS